MNTPTGLIDGANDFLAFSGDTLMGLLIGGGLTLTGTWMQSRTQRHATLIQSTTSEVIAKTQNETARVELRIKQSEILHNRQLDISRSFYPCLTIGKTEPDT